MKANIKIGKKGYQFEFSPIYEIEHGFDRQLEPGDTISKDGTEYVVIHVETNHCPRTKHNNRILGVITKDEYASYE